MLGTVLTMLEPIQLPDAGTDLPPYIPAEYRGIAGFLRWRPNKTRGHGEYKRGSKRCAIPTHKAAVSLAGRLCDEITPWRLWEYPGRAVFIAAIGGVTPAYARHWLAGVREPGAASLVRLSAWLRAKAGRLVALAEDLEAEAATRKPGFEALARARAVKREAQAALLPPVQR